MATNDLNEDSVDISSPISQETALAYRTSSCDLPQASRHSVAREIIDEDGDVLVQACSKEFVVSSKVLILASPVFRAMFSSRFLEGSKTRSTNQPLKLPLPDDDQDALELLFHNLHFSPKWTRQMPDINLQVKVAYLCDKYDCTSCIHSGSLLWLRSLTDKDCKSSNLLWKLSTIAFLLGHEVDFEKINATLASTLSVAQIDGAELNPALPNSLKGMS